MHCKTKCLMGDFFAYAGYFEHYAAGLYNCYPILGSAFTGAHTGLSGLLGYGLVGEYLYPDLTATLDVTGHSHTGCLYLVAGDPGGLHCNEAILAVSDHVAAMGSALHATAVYSPALYSLRHQHSNLPPYAFFCLLSTSPL